MRLRTPVGVAALAAAIVLTGSAVAAGPLRAPGAGAPALQMDAPPAWKIKRVELFGASLATASAADRSGLVAIAMVPSGGAVPPLRDLAQALAGAPFGANVQSSPASLDGHAAEAFTATQPPKGAQPERHVRYLVARIDDHHVGLVVAVTAAGEPDAERKLVEDTAANVRVISAARPAR